MSHDEPIVLDMRGLKCPEPLTMLRNTIREAQAGQMVTLLSDDPVSLRDVPAFCRFMQHDLVSMPHEGHEHEFVVRKKL